jgi:glycosyltransferase involved in cell wall biosynthesis
VLFAGDQVNALILERFRGLASIERSPMFNRRSPVRFLRRSLGRLTGRDPLFRRLMAHHRIAVASHCNVAGHGLPFRTINWIPDFQHLHLPEFFPAVEIARRNRKYRQWLRDSDLMLFSSEDARRDGLRLMPEAAAEMRVLHFVSQANPCIYALDDARPLCDKYGVPEKFFYLPNQFWAHKNHRVVIEAVGLLKQKGVDVHVVCTGLTADLKSSGHVAELTARIAELKVGDRIHLLGMIDYIDVLTLLRHCLAVLNPSRFEGWSSTVEEAKSVGKAVILSDLAVHREQTPQEGCYFNPDDVEALAALLSEAWQRRTPGPDLELERQARAALPERTRQFGTTYQQLVQEAMGRGVT